MKAGSHVIRDNTDSLLRAGWAVPVGACCCLGVDTVPACNTLRVSFYGACLVIRQLYIMGCSSFELEAVEGITLVA